MLVAGPLNQEKSYTQLSSPEMNRYMTQWGIEEKAWNEHWLWGVSVVGALLYFGSVILAVVLLRNRRWNPNSVLILLFSAAELYFAIAHRNIPVRFYQSQR
jgi:hypothetical protein